MNDFAVLMKFLRERSGISARTLSTQSGLSYSYVSKMESGSVIPSVQVFSRILSNLDVTDTEMVYLIKSISKEEDEV
jgi:transcriptional regulator with XRE-family HTH domain